MSTNPELNVPHLVTRILHLPMTSDPEAFGTSARATERVVVRLESPGGERRGVLDEFVTAAIEAELSARGAAPPGWSPADTLEAKIDDQLYRARLLGAGGLALRFESLTGLADGEGRLGSEDSETLRHLMRLAESTHLQLFLPVSTGALRVLGAPVQLSDWLSPGSKAGRIAAIEYEELPASAAAPAPRGSEVSEPPVHAFTSAATAESSEQEPRELQMPQKPNTEAAPALKGARRHPNGPAAPERESAPPPAPAAAASSPRLRPPALTRPQPAAATARGGAAARPQLAVAAPERLSAQNLAEQRDRAQRCAGWVAQLRNMNGPKLHGSIEKAFVTAYLPLQREAAAGRASEDAASALEAWAEGFAQSYASAFRSLASRTKRPRMVRDVIELGIAWLNHLRARQCQLLVIDALRFDLGERLNEYLTRGLEGRAVCADQALLWAALPSNAESQQLGIQRARRAAAVDPQRQLPAAEAGRIETVRAGTRELLRLDHLASDLAKPGEIEAARLDRLAASLAEIIVPWMRAQPPDTLVVLFGDHGFHWKASPQGTSAASYGGALPEQVLTPAFGWLLEPRTRPARANLH